MKAAKTTNDAAERLRTWIVYAAGELRTGADVRTDLLDAALAAERRAGQMEAWATCDGTGCTCEDKWSHAILDAEAER